MQKFLFLLRNTIPWYKIFVIWSCLISSHVVVICDFILFFVLLRISIFCALIVGFPLYIVHVPN